MVQVVLSREIQPPPEGGGLLSPPVKSSPRPPNKRNILKYRKAFKEFFDERNLLR
jgi:hypothetical protein